jgi:hypothetical protein
MLSLDKNTISEPEKHCITYVFTNPPSEAVFKAIGQRIAGKNRSISILESFVHPSCAGA